MGINLCDRSTTGALLYVAAQLRDRGLPCRCIGDLIIHEQVLVYEITLQEIADLHDYVQIDGHEVVEQDEIRQPVGLSAGEWSGRQWGALLSTLLHIPDRLSGKRHASIEQSNTCSTSHAGKLKSSSVVPLGYKYHTFSGWRLRSHISLATLADVTNKS